jgi:hypothetical protein
MVAMRMAVQRFLALLTVQHIKAGLLKIIFHRQTQHTAQTDASGSSTDEPLYAEPDDTEDKFAAWENERNDKLRQAADLEQQGVHLLAQAALLRASMKCEDRGESFMAEELRELADDNTPCAPSDTVAYDRPILRIAVAEDEPLPRGA